MKYLSASQSVFLVALLATLPAVAQSPSPDADAPLSLDLPPAPTPNRFGLSYRAGFNVPLTFKGLGGYAPLSNARLTPDGNLFNYDNGYVLADSGTANSGLTGYWGYDNARQLSDSSTITMQRSSSEAIVSSGTHYENPISGFELAYNRELIHKKSWRAGLEGAFGYSYMSVCDGSYHSATVTRVNEVYAFPQSPPPQIPSAPYTGRLDRPLQQTLEYNPISTTTTEIQQGALILGERNFKADLFSIRLGPYIEVPLSKSISLNLSGGFAAMYIGSDFSFNEIVTIPGVGSVQHSGFGPYNGWLAGVYGAGNVSVALSDAWSLVAGAQYEDLGRYTHYQHGKEASLDFTSAIFVTLGVSYSF